MNAPVDVLAVIKRIAETNAAFATTADRDGIVRVGESMLSLQAADLRAVSAAVAELIKLSRVIDAEFRSDPMAVQCFDLEILNRWQAALTRVGGAQ